MKTCKDIWPIDDRAKEKPDDWKCWPKGKKFALVLTHDVETKKGVARCRDLSKLEEELGFKSSFNFVAEDYSLLPDVRQYLCSKGFEIGVHGLTHDGSLYNSFETFKKQAVCINKYIHEWNAVGFRSPSMHSNLSWIHYLNIKYDASTFDTDPFEPQSDGVCTIFPFWVQNNSSNDKGYVELPYTLPQDFTLFVLMQEKNIEIWKKKLDWIVEQGGMALINTHPDYMNFGGDKLNIEEYPVQYYEEFLNYIKCKYEGQYWLALPKEISHFWLSNVVS